MCSKQLMIFAFSLVFATQVIAADEDKTSQQVETEPDQSRVETEGTAAEQRTANPQPAEPDLELPDSGVELPAGLSVTFPTDI